MAPKLTEDTVNDYIKMVIQTYIDQPERCFSELMKLKYPNSDLYITREYAKGYYESYAKYAIDIKMDKNFDKNAYEKNKKIFDSVHK